MIESLSGKQIGQLVDALLGAYPSRDDLRMMVTIELDETLEAIADGANQRVVTFNLVTWAVRSGRIDDLLAGARRSNPGNRALAALVESWQAAAPAVAPARRPRTTLAPAGPAAIDVFLSYAREDSAAMREVEASLRAAGLAVWTDEGLEAGTPSWSAAIEEAVAQAAAMVVLLSPDAKASVWVENEVALAQRKQKRIFPILVSGDEDNAVPFRLISAQWADGRQGLGPALQRVQPVILQHLGRAQPTEVVISYFTQGESAEYRLRLDSEQAQEIFSRLVLMVHGDRALAESLVQHEMRRTPHTSESILIDRAIARWIRDNR